ncbi:MAG: hypothetical protein GY761_07745 [Hyphomicrobiales bacterium]|nr:hypothetical protein [Hyphomicrobiales bacterium]
MPTIAEDRIEENKTNMVYRLFHDDQEMYSYGVERLDGDLSRVGPVDLKQDEGKKIRPFNMYVGRPIDPTHLTTKIRFEGPKRNITDVYMGGGIWLMANSKLSLSSLSLIPINFSLLSFFGPTTLLLAKDTGFSHATGLTLSIAKKQRKNLGGCGIQVMTMKRTVNLFSTGAKSTAVISG